MFYVGKWPKNLPYINPLPGYKKITPLTSLVLLICRSMGTGPGFRKLQTSEGLCACKFGNPILLHTCQLEAQDTECKVLCPKSQAPNVPLVSSPDISQGCRRVKEADYSNLFLSFFTEDSGKIEEFQFCQSLYRSSRKTTSGSLSRCCRLELRKPQTTRFICLLVPLKSVDSDENPK